MTTVSVKFHTSVSVYDYLYDLSEPVREGDTVVVDSPYNGLVTAKVVGIKEKGGTKYVVDRVDTFSHEQRLLKTAAVAKIKRELDKRMKEVESTLKYKILASCDPTAALLMKQLDDLEK